ncbi:MAG TPA: ABC transporter permease [Gaiellaceae bacterium]|nr:ABC transporter permease [Gaiellaceae bacterium]
METLLTTGLLETTPILLAALGGAINREAGIVNIGLDGMMLAGAFIAVFVDWQAHSAVLGCLAAIGAGAVVGLLFALPITRLGANEIVAGLGLALLMPGLFGYLLPIYFGQASTLQPDNVAAVNVWHIPGLSSIPGVGAVVFSQDPITYVSWLAIPLTWFLLRRTVFGMHLRAAGHNPEVATAQGLPVRRLREASTVIAGALSALGGAQLALATVQLFNKDMTAGRGFVALAAFYFGNSRPALTAVAAFIFGIADAGSIRLQTAGLPDQIPEMIPYLAVVAALVVVALRRRAAARSIVEQVAPADGLTPSA